MEAAHPEREDGEETWLRSAQVLSDALERVAVTKIRRSVDRELPLPRTSGLRIFKVYSLQIGGVRRIFREMVATEASQLF